MMIIIAATIIIIITEARIFGGCGIGHTECFTEGFISRDKLAV